MWPIFALICAIIASKLAKLPNLLRCSFRGYAPTGTHSSVQELCKLTSDGSTEQSEGETGAQDK